MFSWMRDVYRRHKKKFVTLGVVASGAYVSYKLVSWKLSEWREREIEEYKIQAKKQFHYERNQRTCNTTFMQLMIPLRNKIFETLNIEEVTEALTKNPENKIDLWEELKLLGFTRTVTSVVATCTLYVFLQVQMNIIAGYMYLENIESTDSDVAEISELVHEIEMDQHVSDLQKEYLNNIRFLFDSGILKLIDDIKTIVNDIVGPIPLKSRLNHYEVSQMIMNIWDHFKLNGVHDQLSQGATSSSMASPFSKYILEGDQCMKKTIYFDEQKYQQILSETFDVVESEDFQMVLAECVKECLQRVLHSIEHHFQNNLSASGGLESTTDCPEGELRLAVAKLIPIVNAQSDQIFKAGKNDFLESLFSVESINSFSANIYESFSLEKVE